MWHRASTRKAASGEIEILVVLPCRDLRGIAGLAARLGVAARDLRLLDATVIVDEQVAKALPEADAVVQRGERLGKRFRQRLGLDLIGRIGGRAGIELAGDAVEAG